MTTDTALKYEPMTGVVGATVHGVDMAQPLSDAVVDDLNRAVAEHGVLFFHDQELSPEQHRAFGARFGPLHVHPWVRNLGPDLPEIMVLAPENLPNSGRKSIRWHADATFEERPPRGAILRAVELPELGGDTLWASMYAAYEALSGRMQAFLDGLHGVHESDSFQKLIAMGRAVEDAPAEMASTEHPVVATHPVTGRKALYVNVIFTRAIAELSETESDRVLGFLLEHLKNPDFQVRLRWRPGTVAFWDNRASQHYGVVDYTGRRVMHRVTVCGDRPA
jgi:taurine dioxygenase